MVVRVWCLKVTATFSYFALVFSDQCYCYLWHGCVTIHISLRTATVLPPGYRRYLRRTVPFNGTRTRHPVRLGPRTPSGGDMATTNTCGN